jgi:hypothetical protein
VDNLAFLNMKRIFWAALERERGGGCIIGGLSSQCGLDYIVNRIDSHSIISYQNHAKDRHGNTARKP